MSCPTRLLFVSAALAAAFGLTACDSVKNKALAVIDKKIEETGGYPDPSAPGAEDGGAAPAANQELIRKVTDGDYDRFTSLQGHVVVVDFTADWCGPCRRLAPILESIVEDNKGKVLLGKIDVDQNKQVPAREGVRGIPDVRIFVNGKQVDRFVGLLSEKAARQKIESRISEIAAAPQVAAAPDKPLPPALEILETKQPPANPTAKPPAKPQDPQPETPTDGTGEPKEEPKIKRMDKDWLPPGIQRKGT